MQDMILRFRQGFSPRMFKMSPDGNGIRMSLSEQMIFERLRDNQSIPTTMSKLPSVMGITSMVNGWSFRIKAQP